MSDNPTTGPPAVPADELARVRALIAANTWIFAKTMPENPHFYTLRKRWAADEDFDWFVLFIRKYGEKRKFGKYTYVYFEDTGWKYWSMGAPLKATILVNKATLGEVQPIGPGKTTP